MKVRVAVVGKPRDAALGTAIREYEARAARYWPLEVSEVKEESGRSAGPDIVRMKEGERLLDRITPGSRVILCDVGGDALDSAAFATLMQQQRERAQDLAIIIGGAHGVDEVVRKRAQQRIALAPWTLPHELARLVLAEQLYRAGTITRGEPYHK